MKGRVLMVVEGSGTRCSLDVRSTRDKTPIGVSHIGVL